ncbi:type IV pilin N-terminal domain-containing protein [Natrinema thermotolerans]|uniref:Type IV pilin N-terminal domain-containing protein n=1 Tax=Natrinema thermotolerans TaxID=121872 RepID=A0AAF0P9H9_9EURY|nr:type IV pilin N-terminal domain-containing protein [Natrinema thermotolerans]QCC59433.1 type IV pilin [Natrinema thermotolerans]WMT06404.1 type IV pilin N-terminal domain-containing protein [Natrinema thermotolerans]
MDGKSIRNKLIGPESERAVSPVIGVILMVAITVILAAVIAAFVLDLGQGQSANAQAGIDFDEGNDNVTVTVNNIQRADSFSLSGTGDCNAYYDTDSADKNSSAAIAASVGSSVTIHTGNAEQGATSSLSLSDLDSSGIGFVCGDESTHGSSYGGPSSASDGSIQVIGTHDGKETVIAEYEL